MRLPSTFAITCLLSIGFFSCQEGSPEPQLSETQLIEILADIHIAEAGLQALRGDTKDSVSEVYYEQIYAIHDADSTTVHKALAKMRQQPERMTGIYERVMERVEKLNALSKKTPEKD